MSILLDNETTVFLSGHTPSLSIPLPVFSEKSHPSLLLMVSITERRRPYAFEYGLAYYVGALKGRRIIFFKRLTITREGKLSSYSSSMA